MNVTNKPQQNYRVGFSMRSGQERGVALVVGLMLLLIMTLLGIAAMRGTTMQERMSANNQQQAITFQAAEGAVRTMWNAVRADSTPSTTPLVVTANTSTNPADTTISSTAGNGTTNSATLTLLTKDGNCPNSGFTERCHYYLIDATSTQANTGANSHHQQVVYFSPK